MAGQGPWCVVRKAGNLVAVLLLGAVLGWAAASDGDDGLDRSAARRITELTNAARQRNAQPPLSVNPRLTLTAEAYAREMARRDWFGHIGPDGAGIEGRAEASGYDDWALLAENLAMGSGPRDPAHLVESWLSSAEHRRNMLSPDLHDIGVGCYVISGRFWCAQEFGARAQ